MDDKVIINRDFLNNDDFILLDVSDPLVLLNHSFNYIYLTEGSIINVNDYSYKILYNDLEHPMVLKKEYDDEYTLCINPEYYLYNQEKIDTMICNYISNYKDEKFELSEKTFVKDKIIDAIINNKNIKEVSLAKYGDGYTLTLEHFKKFKKAGIKVDSKDVCDELKENFDEIILYNQKRTLISYCKYNDLISKKEIYLDRELTNEELYNLKYINNDLIITLDIDNYEHLLVVNNRLKELGKNNNIKIKLDNKETFNKFVFDNNFSDSNILVETPDLDKVSLKDYLRFEKLLYLMIKNTKDLSPFEKYIYAYNITKQFKDYKESIDKNESRRLYSLLVNEYMVCVGFSRLFGDLLNKMGIENIDLSVSVDLSYDGVSSMETEFKDVKVVETAGHARRYVHLVDPKYNIDGYYIADPTWDNDLEHDLYNYMIMTDDEVTHNKRYNTLTFTDIFNIKSMDEYINKMKLIRNKNHYEHFVREVKRIIDFIKVIDIKLYDELKNKYSFVNAYASKWPENITELIYDLGDLLLKKVNKSVSGDDIFKAVEEVYRHSYGYSEEDLKKVMEEVREDNIKRQANAFPNRYKINQDGSTETIYEDNKFDSVIKM